MQDQCRKWSEANDGGTALEQRCVTADSSSVTYPARMRIYARHEQHNFQHSHSAHHLRVKQNKEIPKEINK